MAQNFLLLRAPRTTGYTDEEARLLDLCLVLHAEHGGGNNSAFACRVLSSSGTDTYSAIAAAVGSLKGPQPRRRQQEGHGDVRTTSRPRCHDWDGRRRGARPTWAACCGRRRGTAPGLIYGMGHAIYTLSDPRAVLLKRFARSLAEDQGHAGRVRAL